MKTHTKKILGLAIFSVLLFMGLHSTRVLAATDQNYFPTSAAEIKNATFEFKDRSTIIAHFTRPSDGATIDVTYYDSGSTDGTYRYKAKGQTNWCGEGTGGGINFDGKNGADEIRWDDPRSLSSLTAHIDIDYASSVSGNNLKCTSFPVFTRPIANYGVVYNYYEWSGTNLVVNSAAMGSQGVPLSVKTFTPTPQYLNNPTGLPSVLESDTNTCPKALISVNIGANNATAGTVYETAPAAQRVTAGEDISNFAAFSSWPSGQCKVTSVNFSSQTDSTTAALSSLAGNNFDISGPAPSATGVNPTGTGSGGTGGTADTCQAGSGGFSLTWLLCPVLDAADKIATSFESLFESQLSFTVNGNISSTANRNSLQNTWDLVKNFTSALVIIILLVMVIAQAIGTSMLDAYAIRKVLPRVIVAVILMQISWQVFSWVIQVFDDAGRGIAEIMYAPFGGASKMGLWALMSNAGISTGTAAIASWTALVGVVIGGVAALPVVLVGLFGASIALLAGLTMLIFRKILIMMCLIFAPLALLAWILPGTQRYYKLWQENFTKALLMFPLIAAMIAAGRIFAYVSGKQTDPTLGEHMLGFLFVLVGFFGPMFFMLKSYKWGGSIMSSAGNAINTASAAIKKAADQPIRGYAERWQGAAGKLYDPSANRRTRALRRIQSGHILPTERSRRLTIAAGDKWANERNDEADALVARTGEMARKGYDRYDMRGDQYGEFARHHGANFVDANGENVSEGDLLDAAGNRALDVRDAAFTAAPDKAHGYHETLTGVEAEKQAYVDLTGRGGSDSSRRAAQAAHKKLLDTHSEIELQNAYIQGGEHSGKRAFEAPTWDPTLQSSPQHYSAANASRPDTAPDVKQSAEEHLGVKYATATEPQREALDRERIRITLSRLTAEQVQSAHYGLYQEIARYSDTYADPVTGQNVNLSDMLAGKLEDFATHGGTRGQSAVGSLVGGKQPFVDRALAGANGGAGVRLADDGTGAPHILP